ncbi:hypothetical protein IFR04_009081 [Cadophora malorum]|uniref:Uncharacterized protein n=1 Tax=Cadophora malorum TaxID=108018 RepID=A0A8H7W9M1_9HELO|nr:hypothetical protein IFR04_009081 [Cadophora malorum]
MTTEKERHELNPASLERDVSDITPSPDLDRQLEVFNTAVRTLLQLQTYVDEIHRQEKRILVGWTCTALAQFGFLLSASDRVMQVVHTHYGRHDKSPITRNDDRHFLLGAIPLVLAILGCLVSLVFKIRRIARLLKGWEWLKTTAERERREDLIERLPGMFGTMILLTALVFGGMTEQSVGDS